MMIDRFQQIANSFSFLKFPAILLGVSCLFMIAATLLQLGSPALDRFLELSFFGAVWALATISFIETFRHIPARTDASFGLFARMKRNLIRAWYWLVALAFMGATVLAVVLSARLISVWLRG